MGKYGGTKLYFSPLGMAVYMYPVKCSVRHAYLVIKISKHSSFSVDFSCCPDPSSEPFLLPCNGRILLFSIFKALLVSLRCFPTFYTVQIQQN